MICPKCGEKSHINGMRLAYFGSPTYYRCLTCGHTWTVEDPGSKAFDERK
jgi:DNA-directed RNA polymerase subunit M/transcription elongation factor TFIIS